MEHNNNIGYKDAVHEESLLFCYYQGVPQNNQSGQKIKTRPT